MLAAHASRPEKLLFGVGLCKTCHCERTAAYSPLTR
jgi:hypothetical protein